MTEPQAEKTLVHFLRHGEVHNPEGILYGRLPGYRLSDKGEQQAKLVAEFLSGHDIARVISSPLQRAQETARPLGAMFQVDVATDDRLIEADNRFEGLKVSVGDGALRSPRHWPKLWNPFAPSWGEPYLEIAHRMLGAAHRARAAAAGREAVCVSHQLPIWTLRRYVEGKPMWHDPRRRQCSLASVTTLVFRGEQLVRVAYVEPAGGTDPRVTGA
ncbi:histidine phosphatase family protein [Saccharopolyspora karakumensis]|jgi:broad specificity phosphatase PhoE|uniref:Histidine phosphatase family protein n=2 Tax=Saccharopolyspora TaxID=1835 RepID=A0A4R4VWU1_9PSEU|nr:MULTISPECIES: histidine phosphatase family protein [Saccharopolyspora]TDD10512.1 histidine phosphatase family protein [Saccharopolyspora terrae]TDD92817.1 histidine phosphatase family protein [Saccharopolyspora karakumensis]